MGSQLLLKSQLNSQCITLWQKHDIMPPAGLDGKTPEDRGRIDECVYAADEIMEPLIKVYQARFKGDEEGGVRSPFQHCIMRRLAEKGL